MMMMGGAGAASQTQNYVLLFDMHVDLYSNSDFFCVGTEIYFSKDDFLLGIQNGQEWSLSDHTMVRYLETSSPVNVSTIESMSS